MERLKTNSLFNLDEELVQKMKDNFLSCPSAVKYIKSLGVPEEVIDNEIAKINDLVCDINFCKKCPGIDKCNKSTPRLVTRITYKDGFINGQLVPCKEYLKYIQFKNEFVVKDFPDEWFDASLKKVNPSAPRAEAIKKYEAYKSTGVGDWIYLTGEEGTGRTYLAANIALDAARNNKGPIAFLNAPTRFKELAMRKDGSFNEILETYMNVPILVLDDLGNEYKTEFIREAILFPILNARSKNRLLTILISDFGIDDFVNMYQTNVASKPKIEQIKKIIKKNTGPEINLGSIAIYK